MCVCECKSTQIPCGYLPNRLGGKYKYNTIAIIIENIIATIVFAILYIWKENVKFHYQFWFLCSYFEYMFYAQHTHCMIECVSPDEGNVWHVYNIAHYIWLIYIYTHNSLKNPFYSNNIQYITGTAAGPNIMLFRRCGQSQQISVHFRDLLLPRLHAYMILRTMQIYVNRAMCLCMQFAHAYGICVWWCVFEYGECVELDCFGSIKIYTYIFDVGTAIA